MADPRHEGLDLIFWKKQVPTEAQIAAIEAKGLGLTPKDRGEVGDDAKKGVTAFLKATDQDAFIASFPPELHDVLRRIAPKAKGAIVTPPPAAPPAGGAPAATPLNPNPSGGAGGGGRVATDTTTPAERGGQREDRGGKGKGGGQHADGIALALLAKAEADQKATEALVQKATAEAEAKKAENDRMAAEAKAKEAEANRLAAAEAREAEERKVAEERSRTRARERSLRNTPDSLVAPVRINTPARSETPPSTPRNRAAVVQWIVIGVLALALVYLLFFRKVEAPTTPVAVQAPAGMVEVAREEEGEDQLRVLCKERAYDEARCDEIVERWRKQYGGKR